MLKEVRVRCPDCRKEFVVDTRTGQLIRLVDRDAPSEELFEDALGKVQGRTEQSEKLFEKAVESEDSREDRLLDAFNEAKQRAKENPDEKPYNPMDWD